MCKDLVCESAMSTIQNQYGIDPKTLVRELKNYSPKIKNSEDMHFVQSFIVSLENMLN